MLANGPHLKHEFVPSESDIYCHHWNDSDTGDTPHGRIMMSVQCGYLRESHLSCNGICVTASDVGLPEYGNKIVHAHPDCDLHAQEQ